MHVILLISSICSELCLILKFRILFKFNILVSVYYPELSNIVRLGTSEEVQQLSVEITRGFSDSMHTILLMPWICSEVCLKV